MLCTPSAPRLPFGDRFERGRSKPSRMAWLKGLLRMDAATRGRGRRPEQNRSIINGILWRFRCGTSRHDVPAKYGNWNTIYHRARPGGSEAVSIPLVEIAADSGRYSIDSTTVRAHVAEGKTYEAEDALNRTYTNALLIIKDGRIVYETYRNNATERDRFAGFSMTKSVTSLLVGCALAEGRIASLDEPIDRYLPELSEGGYRGVTIRQLLQMRSGVTNLEDYSNLRSRTAMPAGTPAAAFIDNVMRYADAARTVDRARAPGSQFDYLNLDTAVLGWLIERVSGGYTIAAYTTKCLWEPLGAEADAYFTMDGEPGVGREFNAAGFNATLRDWARIGLMMLNGGMAKRRVVSEEWVRESTRPLPTDRPNGAGYGYQWWTVANSSAFSASGRFGQKVYIDPETRTVIAKMSYVPVAAFTVAGRESDAFFAAASKWSPR